MIGEQLGLLSQRVSSLEENQTPDEPSQQLVAGYNDEVLVETTGLVVNAGFVVTCDVEGVNVDYSVQPYGDVVVDLVTSGLVGGSLVVDNSVQGNDGVVSGVTFNDGSVSGGVTISDGAMVFDGTGKIELNVNPDISLGKPLTVNLWFYLPSGSSTNVVQIFSNTNDTFDRFHIVHNGGNSVRFNFFNGTSQLLSKSFDISYDTLTNFIYTFDGVSTSRLFVNDIETFGNNGATPNSNIGSFIAANSGGGGNLLNGNIIKLDIFNVGLSENERTALFNAGPFSYSPISDGLVAQYSGKDFLGTPENPTTILDTKTKVSFNGGVGFNFNQE